MSTTVQDRPATACQTDGCETLALRIQGGGLDGRIVRLSSPKCTVGSAPRCTLRLLGPGIRPLHCLIVRGSRGTFVRRWSPDTRLNGRSFEDGRLRPGDRLSVGPLDLEVLHESHGSGAAAASTLLRANPVPPAVSPVAALAPEMAAATAPATPTEGPQDLRRQIVHLRKRAKWLVAALRKSRRHQEELEASVHSSLLAQAEAEERVSQLNCESRDAIDRTADLEGQLAELRERHTQLAQQFESNQQELRELRERSTADSQDDGASEGSAAPTDEVEQRLATLSADLDAHKERERALIKQLKQSKEREAALQRDLQATSEQRGREDHDLSSELQTKAAQAEHLQAELDRLREDLREQQDRFHAERAAWQAERAARAEQLDDSAERASTQAKSGDAEAAIAHLRDLSLWQENASREADPPAAARTSATRSGAPVSFIEKFAPEFLQDDVPSRADASPGDAPPPFTPGPLGQGDSAKPDFSEPSPLGEEQSSAPPPGPAEDEVSLEEYMAKLMQRVRGDEPRPASQAPKPEQGRAPTPAPQIPSTDSADGAAPPKGVFRLEDMKRTAVPPERGSNFDAMRELANQSAHNAISRYTSARSLRDAVGKLLSSVVCLASGIAILYLAPEVQSAATVGGGAALAASVYFGLRGIWSLRNVRAGRKSNTKTPPSEESVSDQVPGADARAPAANETKDLSLTDEIARLHESHTA